jgi:putative sterol carrier protein
MDTVIQYDVTGEGGGKFYMVIKDQSCSLTEGEAVDPKVIVTVSKDDFYAISKGALGGAEAFLTGRMKVDGRVDDILRMGTLFRQP